jgi:hypothetical protein
MSTFSKHVHVHCQLQHVIWMARNIQLEDIFYTFEIFACAENSSPKSQPCKCHHGTRAINLGRNTSMAESLHYLLYPSSTKRTVAQLRTTCCTTAHMTTPTDHNEFENSITLKLKKLMSTTAKKECPLFLFP